MGDWINRLKEQEAAARREQEQRETAQLRQHDLIATKGPHAWEKAVAQIERDVAQLRAAFPDDRAKDLQFARCDGGFALERHAYPQVLLRARWQPEINGVGIETSFRRLAMGDTEGPRKDEIRFSLTGEGDVRMGFDGRGHTAPETLSEALIMKVIGRV